MADFIANTSARIRARNLRAEPVLAELSGMRRFVAKSSLMLGNAMDRFGGWMSDGTAAFTSGALFGITRGSIFGGAIYMASVVLMPALAPLALITFAGFVIHDAARSYNVMKADDPRHHSAKRADWLATKGGALGPVHTPNPNPRAAFHSAIRDINAQDETAQRLARTTDLNPRPDMTYPGGIVPGGFAEAELKRREAQQMGPQGRA